MTSLALRALLAESQRINSKMAKVVDGEEAHPTLLAAIALAVHCARESAISDDDALLIFQRALRAARRSS